MTLPIKTFKLLAMWMLCFAHLAPTAAQDSTQTTIPHIPGITVYGSLDMYYTYDFNQPESGNRPGIFFSHTRHNAININTAVLGVKYESERVRANLALLAGDYSVSNYAAEQQLFQNLYEAYAGVSFGEGWWLDVGVFSSHIGIEGGIGPENPTLSRSLIAHSSPFYESGARLSYTPNEEWSFMVLLLNGWQNIQENNSNKALGTQISFSPTDALTFNSSTFFGEGNNAPDDVESFRYFHNFYVTYSPDAGPYLAFAFDFGGDNFEGRAEPNYQNWWGTCLIARMPLQEKLYAVGRAEYFSDPDRVIMNISGGLEHRVTGFSAGLDYLPFEKVMLRVEGKFLSASEEIFEGETAPTNSNFAITTSLGVRF